jgi:hypothetical protein
VDPITLRLVKGRFRYLNIVVIWKRPTDELFYPGVDDFGANALPEGGTIVIAAMMGVLSDEQNWVNYLELQGTVFLS